MKLSCLTIAFLLAAGSLPAQVVQSSTADTAVKLGEIGVRARRSATMPDTTSAPALQRATLPVSASTTARKIAETVNGVDPEDAVKYLPSLYLRKRNNGDYQATMSTRVWGVGSSARSLVFADGVPITALVANNNTIGAPRWGLVSPEEIERIDVMYGPFSAAYAGNSMGAVMEITTRMPAGLEGSLTQTQALQTFSLYRTDATYSTSQINGTIGDRFGRFSLWASGSYQRSHSQPLSYVTSTIFPNGTEGGIPERNKLDAPANILGASGLLTTGMTNARIKLAYDVVPGVRAAYTFGFWQNTTTSTVDPYLTASGQPTYAGQSGFATNSYDFLERHYSHSLALRTDLHRDWDVEAVGTLYTFGEDRQRSPTTASAAGTTFGAEGRTAVLDSTGWSTIDLKASWHPGGLGARNTVSFGVHEDRYRLYNTTFSTPDWQSEEHGASVYTRGDGKTRTRAAWLQNRFRATPELTITLGGRYEQWRAYDGVTGTATRTEMFAPAHETRFSPKALVTWEAAPRWIVSASAAKAWRFPTVAELYQVVSTGSTFTTPAPDLKSDDVFSTELSLERRMDQGFARVVLFQDDIHNAIISQFRTLVPNTFTLYSYLSNVDHARARGVELSLGKENLLASRFGLSGSVTYLDARTLALSGQPSPTAPASAAIGKRLPNIPEWRANAQVTWRPGERFTLSLAGRYSGDMFTTLDNADVNPNTYQGFSAWFVADARAHYRVNAHWSASLGVDNLNNRKYFFFHPFPQRTFVGSLKYGF